MIFLLTDIFPQPPWWSVLLSNMAPILTALAALIAGVAALRGAQGKRHRNEQQGELLSQLGGVKKLLSEATIARDRYASELTAEQTKCREEAAAMREEIEKNGSLMNDLLRLKR